MDVIENLTKAVELLKEIEEYNDQLHGDSGLLSVCDRKIDYWEHYLEFEDLKVTEAYNIIREIKNQRLLRRKYKNDAELIKVFRDNQAKLQNRQHRDMLLTLVHKTHSKQVNAKYNYDAYTDEERDEILGRKRGIFEKLRGLTEGEKEKEKESEK